MNGFGDYFNKMNWQASFGYPGAGGGNPPQQGKR